MFDHQQPYPVDNGLRWVANSEGAAEMLAIIPIRLEDIREEDNLFGKPTD